MHPPRSCGIRVCVDCQKRKKSSRRGKGKEGKELGRTLLCTGNRNPGSWISRLCLPHERSKDLIASSLFSLSNSASIVYALALSCHCALSISETLRFLSPPCELRSRERGRRGSGCGKVSSTIEKKGAELWTGKFY